MIDFVLAVLVILMSIARAGNVALIPVAGAIMSGICKVRAFWI